jgi:GntR family transcriptional regulator/MocR family aminotransferase
MLRAFGDTLQRAMRTWDFSLPIDPTATTPVFLQIADALSTAVTTGRLRAGDSLPGTREMAALLGVNRNTVVAAYDELRAQGFTTSSPARATLIADDWTRAPRQSKRAHTNRAGTDRAGFDLAPPLPALPRPLTTWPKGTLVMQSGLPDVRLLPVDEIARAYRRALRRHGRALLAYGDERGHAGLRRALAHMLAVRRGLAVTEDDVVVVRGSQMGIDLVARSLIAPGDVVAVEELGYSPAWAALLHAGARLVPIRVDAQGIDVDALASVVRATRVRMIYVTPHHQYPTTVPLAAHRRRALLALARRERIAILEDDFDHELQYEGRPPLPLAASALDVVVYVGTLSKILAPGLRLGFVAGAREMVERIARLRRHVDRQGDLAIEEAVAELLEDGTVLRHVRRMRRAYRARRDVLVDALFTRLGDALAFEVPRGGMALWARTTSTSAERFFTRAKERGVGTSVARDYALDGESRPFVRLGFSALDEHEIVEAVRRLAAK